MDRKGKGKKGGNNRVINLVSNSNGDIIDLTGNGNAPERLEVNALARARGWTRSQALDYLMTQPAGTRRGAALAQMRVAAVAESPRRSPSPRLAASNNQKNQVLFGPDIPGVVFRHLRHHHADLARFAATSRAARRAVKSVRPNLHPFAGRGTLKDVGSMRVGRHRPPSRPYPGVTLKRSTDFYDQIPDAFLRHYSYDYLVRILVHVINDLTSLGDLASRLTMARRGLSLLCPKSPRLDAVLADLKTLMHVMPPATRGPGAGTLQPAKAQWTALIQSRQLDYAALYIFAMCLNALHPPRKRKRATPRRYDGA